MVMKKGQDEPVSFNHGKAAKRRQERKQKEKNRKRNIQKILEGDAIPAPVPIPSKEINGSASDQKSTPKDAFSPYRDFMKAYTPTTMALFKENDWFLQRPKSSGNIQVSLPRKLREELQVFAESIYKQEVENFRQHEQTIMGREVKFRQKVLSTGTSKDKIAAHILCLRDSPIHSLEHFNAIISYVASKKDDPIKEIQDTFCDVLKESVIPNKMMFNSFENNDFDGALGKYFDKDAVKIQKILVIWVYEDKIKRAYTELISTLKEVIQGGVPSVKQKAVKILLEMLKNNPKQETHEILKVLVNKLGDLDKILPRMIIHGLKTATFSNPSLKNPLVETLGEFLNRPNQRMQCHHNCMLLMHDFIISRHEYSLVQKMVLIYFGFFKANVKTGELNSKLMGSILRGLRRALPFLVGSGGRGAVEFLESELNTLYSMVHLVRFKIGVQVLQLLYQVDETILPDDQLSDRFHRVMYTYLAHNKLAVSRSRRAYFDLLFKTMNRISHHDTLKAFIMRLLMVTMNLSPDIVIAALYLLAELRQDNELAGDIFAEIEKKCDELTIKLEEDEVKEEVKKEDDENIPKSVLNPLTVMDDDDSDEEFIADLDLQEDGKMVAVNSKLSTKKDKKAESSEVEVDEKKPIVDLSEVDRNLKYDPFNRNPKFCGAAHARLWPLHMLTFNCHPTVAIFAQKLLKGENLDYKGDPFRDFTTMKFLDKFTNRNPKKISLSNDDGSRKLGARSQYISTGLRSTLSSVNELCDTKFSQVPPELQFMHKFFASHDAKSKKGKPDFEQGDENEDEIEAFLTGLTNKFKDDEELDDEWDNEAREREEEKKKKKDKRENSEEEEEEEDGSGLDDMSDDDGSDFEDEEEEEIKSKKNKDELDDGEDDEPADIDEMDDDSDEDLDDEEEELEDDFSDEEDEEDEDLNPKKKQKLMNMFEGRDLSSMLMDAEDFGEMIQQNGRQNKMAFTSQDLVGSAGKTHEKQLAWEDKRRNSTRGKFSSKNSGKFSSKFSKKKTVQNHKKRNVKK